MLSTLPLVELSSSSSSREAAIFVTFPPERVSLTVYSLSSSNLSCSFEMLDDDPSIVTVTPDLISYVFDEPLEGLIVIDFVESLVSLPLADVDEEPFSAFISVTSFLELSLSSTSRVSSSSYSSLRSSKSTVFPSSLTSMSSVSSRR